MADAEREFERRRDEYGKRIEEATSAALAVGDFDVGNERHHGTPDERRDATARRLPIRRARRCYVFLERT